MAVVGHVEDPATQTKLPIQFVPKRGVFTCTHAGVPYEDTQIQVLREKVLAAVKEYYTLTWMPIIELNMTVPSDGWQKSYFSLKRERKYIAYHENFGWKQIHWTAAESERLAHSQRFQADQEFSVPTARESYGSQLAYLPYSDELWEQLEEIEKYLLLAARKLRSTGFFSPQHVAATLDLCRRLFDAFATNEEDAEDYPGQDL